jgi:hypothetical protein
MRREGLSSGFRQRLLALSALGVGLGVGAPAMAVTIVIGAGAPRLILRVGATGATISTVTFPVTVANVGNGVPINGTPAITIIAEARAPAATPRTATLTVDSSLPLVSGANTLPMTLVSWTTNDATFPASTFTAGAGQSLTSFNTSRRRTTRHTFRYANNVVPAPGTYTARVTYTLTMP